MPNLQKNYYYFFLTNKKTSEVSGVAFMRLSSEAKRNKVGCIQYCMPQELFLIAWIEPEAE